MVELAEKVLGLAPPPPGIELASLPFGALIGGPLIAVINAQVQGAIATVNFVKTIGFKPDIGAAAIFGDVTGEPLMIEFKYQKATADMTGTRQHQLTIPLLTMLPIPTLRVAEVTLAFVAKITSMSSKQVDSTMIARIDAGGQARGVGDFLYSGQVMASAGFQRTSKDGNQVTRDYSLDVKVKMVQDEIPSGLEKLLSMLDSAVKDAPA
mmetsp:Transcript_7966/g.20080  ORF Transcript_7966/g.20080 Transcript_7966/m.20080 type:complete len:209 (+) Transcript_7966:224-850(+)|eukprot:CAMPEP_0177646946 /NCGR_PEP_ID=MMETSP0447-20121125/10038_1 /TAXON_ID=0 /ORGANISM="Stygamoeba regulata, Strain BSH-02190019" /LENGTH=208 /DNA_ID=CAMNT_0019149499 /DNA_START=260 /DNA_END=886 /DNA_ORIENTATION=+